MLARFGAAFEARRILVVEGQDYIFLLRHLCLEAVKQGQDFAGHLYWPLE